MPFLTRAKISGTRSGEIKTRRIWMGSSEFSAGPAAFVRAGIQKAKITNPKPQRMRIEDRGLKRRTTFQEPNSKSRLRGGIMEFVS
jgi:hypothetical protein